VSLVIDELQLLGVLQKPAAPEPEPAVQVEAEVVAEPVVSEAVEVLEPEGVEAEEDPSDRLIEAIDSLQMKLCDLAGAVLQAAREFGAIAESIRGTDGEVISEETTEEIENGETVQS
jgi:hypothetical protein